MPPLRACEEPGAEDDGVAVSEVSERELGLAFAPNDTTRTLIRTMRRDGRVETRLGYKNEDEAFAPED